MIRPRGSQSYNSELSQFLSIPKLLHQTPILSKSLSALTLSIVSIGV